MLLLKITILGRLFMPQILSKLGVFFALGNELEAESWNRNIGGSF